MCQSILDGQSHFPTVPGGVQHAQSDNLGSIKEDMTLLFRMICKYLISGALEWCMPGHEPTNLVPLGLVPKKDPDELFRVIADGRAVNEYLLPWKTKIVGMKASSGLFVKGSYCLRRVLKDFR